MATSMTYNIDFLNIAHQVSEILGIFFKYRTLITKVSKKDLTGKEHKASLHQEVVGSLQVKAHSHKSSANRIWLKP